MPGKLSSILIILVNTTLVILGFFIGLRIILRLFSANPATPIVSWIYSLSSSLIYPFSGIFPDIRTQIGVLDMVAIIALAGYTFFGALLIWLLNTFTITEEEISSYPTAHAHYHDIDKDLEEEHPRHKDYSR